MWEKTALSRMDLQVRMKSLLSSPIPGPDSSSLKGALVFLNKRDKAKRIVPFSVDDERALGMFAVLLGMALHKNEQVDSLTKNLELRKDVFYHYGAILPEQLEQFMAAEADLKAAMSPSIIEDIRSRSFDPHVYSPTDDRLCLIFKAMFLDAGFNEKFKVSDKDLTRYVRKNARFGKHFTHTSYTPNS